MSLSHTITFQQPGQARHTTRVRTTFAAMPQSGETDRSAGEINEMTVGRNEPCPCGSGKKYKKCCGLAPQTNHSAANSQDSIVQGEQVAKAVDLICEAAEQNAAVDEESQRLSAGGLFFFFLWVIPHATRAECLCL